MQLLGTFDGKGYSVASKCMTHKAHNLTSCPARASSLIIIRITIFQVVVYLGISMILTAPIAVPLI